MNPLQKPNSNSNPSPYPTPNPVPNPNIAPSSSTSSSLTFDQVSKLFSLPLFDASHSLGVCSSVLKKICYENGLVRWPYRKILAGKSLEEIKKEAAREKSKHLKEFPKAAGQVNDGLASSTAASPLGTPVENKTRSMQEIMKSPIVMQQQQQGSKIVQTGSPLKLHGSTFTKGTPSSLDEFKYGFPSNGLSSVSYKWWGDRVSNGPSSGPEEIRDDQKSPTSLEDSDVAPSNGHENLKDKNDIDSSGRGSLAALRKKAAKEGQAALKLGVQRRHGINKLDHAKKMVILQIFKSELPLEWRD